MMRAILIGVLTHLVIGGAFCVRFVLDERKRRATQKLLDVPKATLCELCLLAVVWPVFAIGYVIAGVAWLQDRRSQ